MSVLNTLQKEKTYTLNWRPQILCFYHIANKPSYNEIDVLNVVSYLRKGKGLVVIAGIIHGDPTSTDNL
jgi:hypothetical protein